LFHSVFWYSFLSSLFWYLIFVTFAWRWFVLQDLTELSLNLFTFVHVLSLSHLVFVPFFTLFTPDIHNLCFKMIHLTELSYMSVVQMFLAYVICGWKVCPYNSFISNLICEDFVKYELPVWFCLFRKESFGNPSWIYGLSLIYLMEYCSG